MLPLVFVHGSLQSGVADLVPLERRAGRKCDTTQAFIPTLAARPCKRSGIDVAQRVMGGITMRVYIVVASLALCFVGNASGTVVDTGADAQRYCQLLAVGSSRDNVEARSAGSCEGMIETAMFFSKRQGPVAVPSTKIRID